jgi:hypothetical protein
VLADFVAGHCEVHVPASGGLANILADLERLCESLYIDPTRRALIEVDVGGADAELAYWRDNRAGLRTIKCHACLLNQVIADPIEPAVAKCSFPYQRLYQQGTASMQNTER